MTAAGSGIKDEKERLFGLSEAEPMVRGVEFKSARGDQGDGLV